jgi:ABC-2 type transport system permease protein
MRPFRLILAFLRASAQQEMAYRSNFLIGLLYSLLNLGVALAGLGILYGQVESIRGWDYRSTLALLGVYLTVSALRGLFIGPSLDSLAGMDGDILSGRFDFTLLKPVNLQFLVSFRQWRLFALFDLALGLGVVVRALTLPGFALSPAGLLGFCAALAVGMLALYAVLLIFSALVFWSPGFLFTWVFDGIFQLARYPLGLYPGWLRLVLTWIVPVGLVTTLPAQALAGTLPAGTLAGSAAFAGVLFAAATLFFQHSLRRYSSASS